MVLKSRARYYRMLLDRMKIVKRCLVTSNYDHWRVEKLRRDLPDVSSNDKASTISCILRMAIFLGQIDGQKINRSQDPVRTADGIYA